MIFGIGVLVFGLLYLLYRIKKSWSKGEETALLEMSSEIRA